MGFKHFICPKCSWEGDEFFERDFYCPSCGNELYKENQPVKFCENPYFERTRHPRPVPGIFLLEDGRWEFVCECGMGEIWRTEHLARENWESHKKMHRVVDDRIEDNFKRMFARKRGGIQ